MGNSSFMYDVQWTCPFITIELVQCSFLHTSNFKGILSSKIQSFIDELAVFPIGSDAEIAGDHIVL